MNKYIQHHYTRATGSTEWIHDEVRQLGEYEYRTLTEEFYPIGGNVWGHLYRTDRDPATGDVIRIYIALPGGKEESLITWTRQR